jgi:hypothetical protein
MSACSREEEHQWRKCLLERIDAENHDIMEGRATFQDVFNFRTIHINPVAPAFGHPESMVRKMSVHRAATVGPNSPLRQVVIKNTYAISSHIHRSMSSSRIGRSKSYVCVKHITTLAPKRAERIRLEICLADVWTKDAIPYPGMAPTRPPNPFRTSANSVMRKLSMASIATNLTKRSVSAANIRKSRSEERLGRRRQFNQQLRKSSLPERQSGPVVIDFHRAPQAFLPTDFELKPPNPYKGTVYERTIYRDCSTGALQNSSRRSALMQRNRSEGHDSSIPRTPPKTPIVSISLHSEADTGEPHWKEAVPKINNARSHSAHRTVQLIRHLVRKKAHFFRFSM